MGYTCYKNSTQHLSKRFYSVKELANILGVSKALIYERVEKKVIPSIRIGARILIPYDFVEKTFLSLKN